MRAEEQALVKGDRATSVRLSADFHMILAEAAGNIYIVQQMQELVSRTSMLVAMYEAPHAAQCACDEHRDIFTSLLRGDDGAAVRAMRSHLSLVETRLRPGASQPSQGLACPEHGTGGWIGGCIVRFVNRRRSEGRLKRSGTR